MQSDLIATIDGINEIQDYNQEVTLTGSCRDPDT